MCRAERVVLALASPREAGQAASMTQAQFSNAVKAVFGPNAQVSANGDFVNAKDSGVSPEQVTAFKSAAAGTTIDSGGNLAIKAGNTQAQVAADLDAVVGGGTSLSNNTVVFNSDGFKTQDLSDSLVKQFGNNANLDATLKGTATTLSTNTATNTAALG